MTALTMLSMSRSAQRIAAHLRQDSEPLPTPECEIDPEDGCGDRDCLACGNIGFRDSV